LEGGMLCGRSYHVVYAVNRDRAFPRRKEDEDKSKDQDTLPRDQSEPAIGQP
jgi:hypothetical protein